MKRGKLSVQIAKDSFWNLVLNLVGRVGGLAFTIFVTRVLMPENFGIYSLSISIAMIFFSLADLGVNKAFMTYIPLYLKKNNKAAAASYFNYLLRIKLLLSFASAILLVLLAYPLAFVIFKKPSLFAPLVMLGIFVFVLSINSFFEAAAFIFKKVHYISIKEAIYQIARFLFFLGAVLLFSANYYLSGSIISLILAAILGAFFLYLMFKKTAPFLFSKGKGAILDKKRVNYFLFFASIGSISTIMFSYMDAIILGLFLPAQYVGFYSAAFAVIMGIAGFLSISSILLPVFSRLEDKHLNSALNKVFRYSNILIIPAIFGVIALGKYFIRLFYGYDYLPATIPLYFLSFLILESVTSNTLNSLLFSREKSKEVAKILAVSIFFNILLNIALIILFIKISMVWAMAGVAIATLASRYFYTIYLGVLARREMGIKLNLYSLIKPTICSVLMFLAIVSINTIAVGEMNIWIGTLEIIFGAAFYFALMLLIKGINKEDINVARAAYIKS